MLQEDDPPRIVNNHDTADGAADDLRLGGYSAWRHRLRSVDCSPRRSKKFWAIVTLLVLAAVVGVLGAFLLSGHPALPDRVGYYHDLLYVPHGTDQQTLDLYVPDVGDNLPLIIYIHPGAFLSGTKAMAVPVNYTTYGYAVAAINYRLAPAAHWPAPVQDCKAAVRWLRAHAALYRLDPRRFAAYGVSAGGYLATMLGVTGDVGAFDVGSHLDQSSRVQATVDYCGMTDFLQMDRHALPNSTSHDAATSGVSLLMGAPIQTIPDRVRQANPITYITPTASPFLIVHGDADHTVPHHQSELLAAALAAAGVPVTFFTVPGGGHARFADPRVPTLTRDFLDTRLVAGR